MSKHIFMNEESDTNTFDQQISIKPLLVPKQSYERLNFEALKTRNYLDKMIYTLFTELLRNLDNCTIIGDRHFVINRSTESDFNHQLLIDSWPLLAPVFKLETKLKTKQKFVRQTLKAIVDYINENFIHKPIEFISYSQTSRDEVRTKTTYATQICW